MERAASPQRKSIRIHVFAVPVFVLFLALQPGYCEPNEGVAEAEPGEPLTAQITPVTVNRSYRPFSKIAMGFTFGVLGAGVEVATPLSRRTNLRMDCSFFNYSPTIHQDGFNYDGKVHLRDVRASYDFFPFHGSFRVSAGLMVYNRLNMTASGTTSPGGVVSMNNVNYYSSQSQPLRGTATFVYGNKVAPTISIGWGNAIPRSGRHFAFPVEIGIAFTGTPSLALSMQGSACGMRDDPTTCSTSANMSEFTANLVAEQNKINKDLKPAHYYPILSGGVDYRF